MKLFRNVLIVILILLQYRLWFGDNAYSEYQTLNNKVRQLESANDELRLRNKIMLADIEDLKSGLEAIEEKARNELGLIKQNEVFYRIVPTHE
ncbi:septum formation initiator [Catenovulum agarivorans DS-2]|uniref:Cell division protein FtsB n=1 Tax=Catenovulum agarivorans DS-2 TaxID=1328313 RepID=W7QTB6_9ALTE|nr:cell division protein FtsB [Catenovulum agarivorans]EWH08665.1 septum formation initiator [Catenovulum agarivorans DS-2]